MFCGPNNQCSGVEAILLLWRHAQLKVYSLTGFTFCVSNKNVFIKQVQLCNSRLLTLHNADHWAKYISELSRCPTAGVF